MEALEHPPREGVQRLGGAGQAGEGGAGDVVAWLEDDHEANAALLAHSWNIRDELIEALEIAIELANMSDDEYERQPEKDPTKALDAVLTHAKTVEMP